MGKLVKLNLSFKTIISSIENDRYLLVIPLLTILVRLVVFLFIPIVSEDAFITFRYAENLVEGNGLVYNVGEKVYGTTTPLFALIIAFVNLFGISSTIAALIINLLAEAITSLIVYKFLKDQSNQFISVLAALLFVFSPSNISWAIQGMETALYGSVIAASFFFLYKEKHFYALLFGFFAAIIRIDGISVAGIILLVVFFRERFNAFKILALPLAIYFIWLVSLYLYFGNFLPNSMLAKLVLYSGHQTSYIPNLKLVLSKYFLSGFYTSSILSIIFLIGVVVVIKQKLKLYPMIIWLFAYYLALVLSKTGIHGWYFIPPLFVYITISGVAIIYLFEFVRKRLKIRLKTLNWVSLIVFILCTIIVISIKINQLRKEYNYEKNVREQVGKYLNQNTSENATIFLEPIGIIGYHAKRYIYDDAALISPIFLKLNRLPDNVVTRYKKINLVKPDYVVLRERYLEDFYIKTPLLEDYTPIKTFDTNYKPSEPDYSALTIFKYKK